MNCHSSKLVDRQPIAGRVPMTTTEWYMISHELRSSGTCNPFLLVHDDSGDTIVPIILTDYSSIKTVGGARA